MDPVDRDIDVDVDVDDKFVFDMNMEGTAIVVVVVVGVETMGDIGFDVIDDNERVDDVIGMDEEVEEEPE